MSDHILANIKAYAALVASLIPTLLAFVPADSQLHVLLVFVGMLVAGFVVQKAPANKPKPAKR